MIVKAYMTNGTYEFLSKLQDKYPQIAFYYMAGGGSALAYYENYKKNIFTAGREYLVLQESGSIKTSGYVVMNNIAVTDDGTAAFEDRFKQRAGEIDKMPGFQAFRLLKPKKGNTYVVFTQWASETDFESWKNSDTFQKQHQHGPTKPPAFFADKPFVTTYTMIDQD
ncbi:antibiotic biosynthesis monooxygenase family protein [Virgibacillus oceani]|uniref:antibiotic biosynthesis monooxygenase family protein n=1 Tax=Virgibacillus oceani TaxID=1479511 RepID=UPI001E2BEF9B|nr:antibiotic biosynthesis monooxygenase [Virgibacillus oceani]